MTRLIRRTILAWQNWRSTRAIRRAYPDIRRIDEAIRDARRRHGPVANLLAAKRAFMTDALRGRV